MWHSDSDIKVAAFSHYLFEAELFGLALLSTAESSVSGIVPVCGDGKKGRTDNSGKVFCAL